MNMAYNPNFTTMYQSPYNQNFYSPYQQQQFYNPNMQMQPQQNQQNTMQNQVQPQNIQNTPPVQNSGFIRVQSEEEARRYPVAPGGSVTFIDENAPYCYTKSVDFSQLDRPTFKRFRLVEESADSNSNANAKENITNHQVDVNFEEFAKITDLEQIEDNYKALKTDFEKLKANVDSLLTSQSKNIIKPKKENDKNE